MTSDGSYNALLEVLRSRIDDIELCLIPTNPVIHFSDKDGNLTAIQDVGTVFTRCGDKPFLICREDAARLIEEGFCHKHRIPVRIVDDLKGLL